MPLNRDFVGRKAPRAEPFEVTRGDIRRFATAIGDANPACHDVAAAQALGHRDLVAPPTFLITLAMAGRTDFLADPELGLQYEFVVHGQQKFELRRPVCAGDVLDSEARIEDIRDARDNELMQIISEISCDGEPVATATNTLVSRGTAAPREV